MSRHAVKALTPSQSSENTVAFTGSMWYAIVGASIGTAFEWYEFIVFGSLAATLAPIFFAGVDPSTAFLFTLLTLSAGLVMRPLGGVIFGRLGDKLGRKTTFVVTILLMGFATVGMGCLPGYAAIGIAAPIILVGLRILQGLAAGGELTTALTYLVEYAPPKRRAMFISCALLAANTGLFLSFAVIEFARWISGDQFGVWGWRVPFLASVLLLAVSMRLRLRMHESPMFLELQRHKLVSKAPLGDALRDRKNLANIGLATLLISGHSAIYWVVTLYTTLFLVQIMKADAAKVNVVVLSAVAVSLVAFPIAGWISDNFGRKRTLLCALIITTLAVFPFFKTLSYYSNPELMVAQERIPATLEAHSTECSIMLNPLGNRRFTTACDVAKQALIGAGLNYTVVDAPAGGGTVIRVGQGRLVSYDSGMLGSDDAKTRDTAFKDELRQILTAAGYPVPGSPVSFNGPMLFILLAPMLFVTMILIVASTTASIEMFKTRVRLTSISISYNIAAGWVGGLLATFVFAISVAAGNIYAGLWYPVGWATLAIFMIIFFYKDLPEETFKAEI